MRRFRATLAYDGTAYQGFQRQASGIPTIQAEVEAALAQISGTAMTIIGAGRTDAGVHATGQVIAFDLAWRHDENVLLRALNALLPDDIAVQGMRITTADFHPRFDAQSRRYVYIVVNTAQRQPLYNRTTWQVYGRLDFAAMQAAAGLLVGEHDFASFGNPPQGTNTVREVFASDWTLERRSFGAELRYTVEANAFLQHMVRRMVGMQVDVGLGLLTVEAFAGIFRSADLSQAKTLAPPQGLILEKVRYPDED